LVGGHGSRRHDRDDRGGDRVAGQSGRCGAHDLALVERGRATSAVEFVQRRDELGALTRFAATWWGGGFDLLLTPTVQAPAPALGELMEGDPATLLQRQLRWFPLTPFANVSGQRAISVPVDSGIDALPVGVHLIAGLGREDVLIRIAAQLERAMPWRGVAPAFAYDKVPRPGPHTR
jgi:amidase